MAEYIEREAAIVTIMSEPPDAHYPHWYADKIKAIPAADVALVRHGSIIETIEDGRMKRVFSCCGADFTEMTCWMTPKYCPNCGAKMDGGVDNGKDQSDTGGV